MRYFKMALIIIILGIVSFGYVYADVLKDAITGNIESAVNKNFARADRWECDIDGNMMDWVQGKTPELELVGTNVLYDEMLLRKVRIVMTDVRIDLIKKRLKSCKSADFMAEISDREMTNLIKTNLSSIENPKVISKEGLIQVCGQYKVTKLKVNFDLISSLDVKNGKNFMLGIKEMKITNYNIGIPDWIQKKISDSINPVYTFPENEAGLYIKSVVPMKRYFVLNGSLDPQKMVDLGK